MKKYDIHIAIAKAMGWTKIRAVPNRFIENAWEMIPSGYPPGKNYECNLPSYTVDLNAMVEPEASLSGLEYLSFGKKLNAIWFRDNKPKGYLYRTLSASAAQRAEAWLKTKKLWVEDED